MSPQRTNQTVTVLGEDAIKLYTLVLWIQNKGCQRLLTAGMLKLTVQIFMLQLNISLDSALHVMT